MTFHPAVSVPSLRIGRPEGTLAAAYENLLPPTDRWNVEAFTEEAQAQLKRLAAVLARNAPLAPADRAALFAEDFSCTPLRPDARQAAFQDASTTVERSPAGDGERRTIESALEQLLAAHEGADVRAAFKIVRVEQRPESVHTTVRFQAASRQSSRAVQQNATWFCDWAERPDGAPRLRAVSVTDYEEVASTAGERWFADRTAAVLGGNASYSSQLVPGVDYWRSRMDAACGIHFSGHHGLAVGDVNGNGLDDLYLCQPGGLPNRLFLQNPDGTARDVSADAGVDWLDASHCALLVDLDNDGDQDLVVGLASSVVFMENDGTGRFTVRRRIPTNFAAPIGLAAADYNGDGRLDVYVCVSPGGPLGLTGTQALAAEAGPVGPEVYHDANNGGENILLRNDGGWKFSDVTRATGLDVNNRRFSFAAAWEDFDGDGALDLYVANDFGRNNLYRNDGGRFVDVAAEAGVEDIAAGMSVAWGDYNNDGRMDLYVGNMFSSAGNRVTYDPGFRSDLDSTTLGAFRRHARGNTLFENAGDGTFRDVSEQAAVTMGRWAWSSNFLDLNNNGWEDLFVANGYVSQEPADDL